MDSSEVAFRFKGQVVSWGEKARFSLNISASVMSEEIAIPFMCVAGMEPGPKLFITAAVHGDEINGLDMIRRLIPELNPKKMKGMLLLIPIANVIAFRQGTRALSYNRDLNRFFPGKQDGNNAERYAHGLFEHLIRVCDYGIDIHTAAVGRSNLPQIRGDLDHPEVKRMAKAFGAGVVLDQAGVAGSLRREATEQGVPTILYEAGETHRFSAKISALGLRGILNVLHSLNMLPDKEEGTPHFQVIVKSSEWVRAELGGILNLSVRSGDLVYEGDILGVIVDPFGSVLRELFAPLTGIVIGITTTPLVVPGAGVIHLARIKKTLEAVERHLSP
jgi:uncharacterized protein